MTNHTLPLRFEHDGTIVLGAMVRTLGAFPSGWRYPGAHRDPAADPKALKRVGRAAEKAGLDYIFLGDWLSTDTDLEFSDPHLLSRVDPMSTAAFLAAFTHHIGIIGTVSTVHSEPYAVARAAASIDRLSGGRFALNLTLTTDPRGEANFGRAGVTPEFDRFDVAKEFVAVLRGLWDTWDDDAFTRDASGGSLINRELISSLNHIGQSYAVAGPLNVQRPVQGHVPIMHSGTSHRAQEFAAEFADIYLVAPADQAEAVRLYDTTKRRAVSFGRRAADLTIIAPILPIIGVTRTAAHAVYDRLVELFQVHDGSATAEKLDLPANRNVQTLLRIVGLPLTMRSFDESVSASTAARFNRLGDRLINLVTERSGRTVGGTRPVTYRHLLVAHLIRSPIIVGDAVDIADYIECWYRAGAVDGFSVLSAFLHEQFELFASLVVPELRRRGLVREAYTTTTLRGHLGSSVPARRVPSDHLIA
ncbi:NtaA/DmoA family FMN-dependent monooxygenase [Cryobacterium luteum]|uniref:LLM class flavin-dependent oxidoreductase n=1 Tax=Cryobacterium luteum TaxID=1424661 RepID=A0A1H8JDR1_9MICO|nr:NtaA/DmoA family FMN-dependent monooxygenase [Cryobacterium luteum]TFB92339.1 LLM class flavin-dependent oxidoreductase [Cryobacterium luteum]SEN78347.1 FMN-dependent oxidoreductase, nitrilotriacetate monooxygenase family [Cryobacterium luteum]